MTRPQVEINVTLESVDPWVDSTVRFGLDDSPETRTGKTIVISVRDAHGDGYSVNVDPSEFLDASDLLLEAVNTAAENDS